MVLFVLLFYFLAYIGQPLSRGEWCLPNDYLGYYSAGQIMAAEGPSAIYDYDLLEKYQADLYRLCGAYEEGTEVISMVYLPIFQAPFLLLAQLNFPSSVIVWIVLNAALLLFYLIFFSKKLFGKAVPFYVILMVFVSVPVFRNFLHGQVNLLLLIAMGEFIRAIMSEKPYRAGLWLGLVLLKPQMLILILPFLLIQKQYKALVGFTLSSILIVAASYLVGGAEGMLAFRDVIFESAQGGATSNYELMMNWRAVSYYISEWLGSGPGWAVLVGGTVVTAAIPLFAFRRKIEPRSPKFVVALLGVMAATLVVTYHAHTHSAMIVIPILLYLYLSQTMKERVFTIWFLTPSVFNLLQFLIGALVVLSILPFGFAYFVNFSNGLVLFVLNLGLLAWAVYQTHQKGDEPETPSS